MNPKTNFLHRHNTLLILLLIVVALLLLAYALTQFERENTPREALPQPTIIRTTQTGAQAQ